MSIECQFIPDQHLVIVTATGSITGPEMLTISPQLTADPRWRNDLNVLIDYSDATGLNIDSQTVRQMVAQDQLVLPLINHCRIAVVAPHHLTFGMARMWESLSAPNNLTTAVFRDLPSALTWLAENPVPQS